MFRKIIDWVGEHKLLTGVGVAAAGLGYLTVSSAASAALPPPKLPGTTGVTPLPGGGLHVQTDAGPVIIPPPAAADTGNALYVTTKDPAPNGNLNARATSNPNSAIVGYYPKGGAVEVFGGPENGMMFVSGPAIVDGKATTLKAWASMAYLKGGADAKAQADAAVAAMGATGSAVDLMNQWFGLS